MSSADFRVLLGVMSNPTSPRLRAQLREWNTRFSVLGSGVDVRYVFGARFHNQTEPGVPGLPPEEAVAAMRAEAGVHDDFLFVDGRERLPHVGVVTEKSAAFWREAAVVTSHRPYHFYCKCDDDTMVHLERLYAVLAHVARSEGPERPIYVGHMKWRGWDVGYRFQACGGSWGNAVKTAADILHGDSGPCPHAAGPYPYMSGGMVCMSRALQQIVSQDDSFAAFLTVAKARNDHGERCRKPSQCAGQPAAVHMWHHEDAGIGFNVFRAVVRANASASIVPVPGHYNDPGIIERTQSPQDLYWSSRALFVHGIKQREHYDTALRRWALDRPSDHLTLRCDRNCATRGHPEGYGWEWARLPCPLRRWDQPQTGRFCDVLPSRHYRCCSWPWVVPGVRTAILKALADAPGQRLQVPALVQRARREAAGAAIDDATCTGQCPPADIPGGAQMHAVLEDLHERGDLRYSANGRARSEAREDGPREVWLEPRRQRRLGEEENLQATIGSTIHEQVMYGMRMDERYSMADAALVGW